MWESTYARSHRAENQIECGDRCRAPQIGSPRVVSLHLYCLASSYINRWTFTRMRLAAPHVTRTSHSPRRNPVRTIPRGRDEDNLGPPQYSGKNIQVLSRASAFDLCQTVSPLFHEARGKPSHREFVELSPNQFHRISNRSSAYNRMNAVEPMLPDPSLYYLRWGIPRFFLGDLYLTRTPITEFGRLRVHFRTPEGESKYLGAPARAPLAPCIRSFLRLLN